MTVRLSQWVHRCCRENGQRGAKSQVPLSFLLKQSGLVNDRWFVKSHSKSLLQSETGPILHWESSGNHPVLTPGQPKVPRKGRAQHKPPLPTQALTAAPTAFAAKACKWLPCSTEEADYTFYIKILLLIQSMWEKEPRLKCQSQENCNMYQQMKMWMKKFQQVLRRENRDPQNLLFWLKRQLKELGPTSLLNIRHQENLMFLRTSLSLNTW